jgi:hypothetical protein
VAVLAAEGVPTNAAPALPAVIQLLTNLGIAARLGACATTAWGLAKVMQPAGMVRPYRGMPAGLLASVIRAVLTQDQVLPHMITVDTAEGLIADSANVLAALSVEPVENGGGLAQWPIVAEIIDAAPLPVPYEPWER